MTSTTSAPDNIQDGPFLSRLTPRTVRGALAFLVLITLVPTLLLLAAVDWFWYRNHLDQARQTNLEVSRAIATALDSYLQDLFRQQHTLAAALRDLADHPGAHPDELLEASREQYESVRAIHWVDAKGIIVASSDPATKGLNLAERESFQVLQSGQERVISDLLTSPVTGEPVFVVGERMPEADGRFGGAVLTIVYPEALSRTVMNIRVAPSDFLVVFDSTGTVVFSNNPRWMGLTFSHAQDAALYEALAGREADGTVISPDTGARRLAARVPVRSTGWVTGAGVSLATMASPLLRSVAWISVLIVAVAALCLTLAVLIGRRISLPLDALRRHAHAIGEGRLDHRARVHGLVELEELAGALNRMSEQLAAARVNLEQTNADLRRSNRDLEQFAYIASHDLQEPLRAVGGFVTLLQQHYRGRLDERADSFIAAAVDGAARMQGLINGLLEYSRVGTRGNPPVPTKAEEALRNALENLQASIQESGATVTSDSLPTVRADTAQLVHVFQNLIGNAIRFRSERPLEIRIGARQEDHCWQFWVRDNGIGIEPQYGERIFLIFQRLHTRTKYPGTGIGLAICKRIVERHGGQIWVESQPGRGSTFYFTLPDAGARHEQSCETKTD